MTDQEWDQAVAEITRLLRAVRECQRLRHHRRARAFMQDVQQLCDKMMEAIPDV